MTDRANAVLVLARRRVFESAIHPGFYLAVTVELAVAFVFVAAFVRSIDSSGFNSRANPFYWVLGGLLSGGFGDTFVADVFSRGPLLIAVNTAFLPVLLSLAVGSIHKFVSDRALGAIELLTFGPSDGTAYFLASIVKDMVLAAAALLFLLVFLLVSQLVENLPFDPAIPGTVVTLFLTVVSVCSYGVFISTCTRSANAAVAIFAGGFVVLALVLAGSSAVATSSVHGLSVVVATVVQWVSPLYYWSLGIRGASSGNALVFCAGSAGQVLLAAAALLASHRVLRARGVRP